MGRGIYFFLSLGFSLGRAFPWAEVFLGQSFLIAEVFSSSRHFFKVKILFRSRISSIN